MQAITEFDVHAQMLEGWYWSQSCKENSGGQRVAWGGKGPFVVGGPGGPQR